MCEWVSHGLSSVIAAIDAPAAGSSLLNVDLRLVLPGVVQYIGLVGASTLVGYGLLVMLRLSLRDEVRVVLSPVAALVAWVLTLGILVGLRFPIKSFATIAWLVSVIPALVAVYQVRRLLRNWRWLALCAVLPMVALWPHFCSGLDQYVGVFRGDGWSYLACAQYFWEYPRGTEGGLLPIDQYASAMSIVRYIAPSMLAFLSAPLSPGDPFGVLATYEAWLLFCLAGALAAFWVGQGKERWLMPCAVTVTVCGGWMVTVVCMSHVDNLAALVFVPATAALLGTSAPPTPGVGLALGGLFVAFAYTYPTLLPFQVPTMILAAADSFAATRSQWFAWLRSGLVAVLSVAVLVFPATTFLIEFALSEYVCARGGNTEMAFAGLSVSENQPAAFWGMGGIWSSKIPFATSMVAAALTYLAAGGVLLCFLKKRRGLAAALLLQASLIVYFLFVANRHYAAYKLINLSWWLLVMAVLSAVQWLLSVTPGRGGKVLVGGACALLGLQVLWVRLAAYGPLHRSDPYLGANNVATPMSQYRAAAAQITAATQGSPFFLCVRDRLLNETAAYLFRDADCVFLNYGFYMGQLHILPLLEHCKPVVEPIRFVLADQPASDWFARQNLTWQGDYGAYQLWALAPACAAIVSIDSQNGLEHVDGDRWYFWLGDGDTVLRVVGTEPGLLTLSADFVPGPSVVTHAERELDVHSSAGYQTRLHVSAGRQTISVPVAMCDSEIVLRCLDEREREMLPNDDRRPLFLGVRDLRASLEPAILLVSIGKAVRGDLSLVLPLSTPWPVEKLEGRALLWLGTGPAEGLTFEVASARRRKVQLRIEADAGHGRTDFARHLVLTRNGEHAWSGTFEESAVLSVDLELAPGDHRLCLCCTDEATVRMHPNGDTRNLLVALRGVTVTLPP